MDTVSGLNACPRPSGKRSDLPTQIQRCGTEDIPDTLHAGCLYFSTLQAWVIRSPFCVLHIYVTSRGFAERLLCRKVSTNRKYVLLLLGVTIMENWPQTRFKLVTRTREGVVGCGWLAPSGKYCSTSRFTVTHNQQSPSWIRLLGAHQVLQQIQNRSTLAISSTTLSKEWSMCRSAVPILDMTVTRLGSQLCGRGTPS